MNLVVLNPNTNSGMTDAVVTGLKAHLPSTASVLGLSAREGCAVIDSRETYAIGAASAAQMLQQVPSHTTGILLACFGDPGLAALREATSANVVGLAEAAVLQAHAQGLRFAIITAGPNWVSMLTECVADYGAAQSLVGVYALAGNGAALRRDPEAFSAEVTRLAQQAQADGAQALILGGAAFAGLHFDLPAGLHIIDPLQAAAHALI